MDELYFRIIAIVGLIAIILGTYLIAGKGTVRRRFTYPLLIIGGVCLEVYSIYIQDMIFIILQGVFILNAIWGLIRLHEKHRRSLRDGKI